MALYRFKTKIYINYIGDTKKVINNEFFNKIGMICAFREQSEVIKTLDLVPKPQF